MSDPRPDTGPGLLRALGALAIGSVLAFVAFGQPWVTLTVREPGLPAAIQTVTGRDLAAAPGILPVLLLALGLVIWATGRWLRRAVGVVVVVVSAVVLVAAVRGAPGLLPS
ncbi:MAG: Trp biosynthesis-associated membrane protein, partial [Candidatus Nanopelagicales bacterium]